jgi:hypothetical protein
MENGLDSISDPAMSNGLAPMSTCVQGLQGISLASLPATHPDIPAAFITLKTPETVTHKDAVMPGVKLLEEL